METHTKTHHSFASYMDLTRQLVKEGKTTGPDQSESMVKYTQLNLQRMERINKTMALRPDLVELVKGLDRPTVWQVLSEPWCGDAAQNLPYIAQIASLNPNIHFEILLRDENPELMDQHLTNGGRAIPKLIISDKLTGKVMATWGPRPVVAQEKVWAYKAMENKPSYEEFTTQLHGWYTQNKGAELQGEFLELLKRI